jgi:hypothetical protein
MANQTAGNPIIYDNTTGASWTGTKYVRLFQWVELNEDLADGDQCKFVVNGVTLDSEVQVEVTANFGTIGSVIWNIGPFSPGVPWTDFTLSVLDAGAVHIWID